MAPGEDYQLSQTSDFIRLYSDETRQEASYCGPDLLAIGGFQLTPLQPEQSI
jgi:hypothetical protein